MADPQIKFKRSSVASKRPSLGILTTGEFAINIFDGSLFTVRDTGGVGIATTVTNLTPWTENYGGESITYSGNQTSGVATITTSGDAIFAGVVTATAFHGDGSGLSNIVSSASTSIVVSDQIQVGIITASSQFYPPSLTTTERDAITFNTGAFIFNETENRLQVYLGSTWASLTVDIDPYSIINM